MSGRTKGRRVFKTREEEEEENGVIGGNGEKPT